MIRPLLKFLLAVVGVTQFTIWYNGMNRPPSSAEMIPILEETRFRFLDHFGGILQELEPESEPKGIEKESFF